MTNQEPTVSNSAWFTLGTSGGPFQQTGAHQISNALTVGCDVYLFDVGNGVLRQMVMAGLDGSRVRAVFLSHHHPDHIADLGLVMLTHWLSPGDRQLTVHGPTGTGHLVSGLADAYRFTAATVDNPSARNIGARFASSDVVERGDRELMPVYSDENIAVEAVSVDHFRSAEPWSGEPPHAIGFRVTTSDRIYAYTGDTGASASLETLARGADLLVSEVVMVDEIVRDLNVRFASSPDIVEGVVFNMKHNHIGVSDIATIAKGAGVRGVVLTHFVPLPSEQQRDALRAAFATVAPDIPITVARDLEAH